MDSSGRSVSTCRSGIQLRTASLSLLLHVPEGLVGEDDTVEAKRKKAAVGQNDRSLHSSYHWQALRKCSKALNPTHHELTYTNLATASDLSLCPLCHCIDLLESTQQIDV